MGYFAAKSNALFKTDANGGLLFYPRSYWGKGYVVPDEATKTRINKFIKKYMAMVFFVILGNVLLLDAKINALVLLPIFLTFYFFKLRNFTKGMPVSKERLTFIESITNSAKSDSLVMLSFFFLAVVALVSLYALRLGAFEMIDYTKQPLEINLTLAGGILLGVFYAWKIYINLREKQRVKNI
ncbi:hypothetical protein MNBD_NITROSPINAE05-653 [hydrothermal vent metagenome]|uniref:Uncharacterized protein n=1 Tax=hydrothermal vent metagenome TaxID=652676 RepID=A0A3B1CA02_9ZZZZ